MAAIGFVEDLPLGQGVTHVAVICFYGHCLEHYQ